MVRFSTQRMYFASTTVVQPRLRSHSIGDNNPPPGWPFFFLFLSNIAACLIACLLASCPSPAYPPPRDLTWDRQQHGLPAKRSTKSPKAYTAHLLVWHSHRQVVLDVLLVVCPSPSLISMERRVRLVPMLNALEGMPARHLFGCRT